MGRGNNRTILELPVRERRAPVGPIKARLLMAYRPAGDVPAAPKVTLLGTEFRSSPSQDSLLVVNPEYLFNSLVKEVRNSEG